MCKEIGGNKRLPRLKEIPGRGQAVFGLTSEMLRKTGEMGGPAKEIFVEDQRV